MQRQELSLHGAQGKGTKLAELPIPAKYRYVPENTPANSPYNELRVFAARSRRRSSVGRTRLVQRFQIIDML